MMKINTCGSQSALDMQAIQLPQ